MLTLEKFEFPVRIQQAVHEGDDTLWMRFRFQESLTVELKKKFVQVLGTWYDRVFDAELANYMDDDIRWYTKSTLAVVYLDTGGTEPELAPYLNDLFREVNGIAPLKEVRLEAY